MRQHLKTIQRKASRNRLLNIKVTSWEEEQIRALADRYAGGNKSEWMRFASLNYQPKKKDLAPMNAEDPTSPLTLAESAR